MRNRHLRVDRLHQEVHRRAELRRLRLGWSLSYDQDLYQIWHSSQIQLPGSLNFVSYTNPEVDRLIEKARTEFDLEKVKQYTHRVQELIYDDQPYCFLFYPMANVRMPKGLYTVKRPDPRSDAWIDEPIQPTKRGITVYQSAGGPASSRRWPRLASGGERDRPLGSEDMNRTKQTC